MNQILIRISETKSTDILIKPKEESPFENYEERERYFRGIKTIYLTIQVKMISLLRWIKMIEKRGR